MRVEAVSCVVAVRRAEHRSRLKTIGVAGLVSVLSLISACWACCDSQRPSMPDALVRLGLHYQKLRHTALVFNETLERTYSTHTGHLKCYLLKPGTLQYQLDGCPMRQRTFEARLGGGSTVPRDVTIYSSTDVVTEMFLGFVRSTKIFDSVNDLGQQTLRGAKLYHVSMVKNFPPIVSPRGDTDVPPGRQTLDLWIDSAGVLRSYEITEVFGEGTRTVTRRKVTGVLISKKDNSPLPEGFFAVTARKATRLPPSDRHRAEQFPQPRYRIRH